MLKSSPIGTHQPVPRPDNQHPAHFGQTPWQTVGPFFHYALPWKGGADLIGAAARGARPELFPAARDMLHQAPDRGAVQGECIDLRGRILDADGAPVGDAMLEIWQADAFGRYPSAVPQPEHGFIGFGRAATSDSGDYHFHTIRPGRVAGPGNTLQAPHIAIGIFGRGLLKRLVTRLYFAGDPANEQDPILQCVPEARRHTLLAREQDGVWRLDIHLQGERETVFFDV